MSTPPVVPPDEEAKQLALEQKKAEASKAIAEAQKATLAADFPASETKPLEGKTAVGTGVGLVAQLLAYKLLGPAATDIANALKSELDADASILIVEDRALIASDWPYTAIREQLKGYEQLIEALKQRLEPVPSGRAPRVAIGPVVAGAAAVIGAAATIVGMFRAEYSITSKDVKIGTTPLVAAVARQLLKDHQVEVDQFALLQDTGIVQEFWETYKKRVELEQASAAHKGPAKDKAQQAPEIAEAEATIKQFDAFVTAAITASKGANYSPLVAAALREALHGDEPKHSHVLYVAIEGTGGETVTRRSLFGRSGQVTHMGGAQVSYLLLDTKENKTVAAGTDTLFGHLSYDLKKNEAGKFVLVELKPAK
ncbi:MAG: hypothetical protein ACLQMH_13380 [Solirubrobacteraceae bacterium]